MKPCLKSKTKSKLRVMAPTCNQEFKASLGLHCEVLASKGYCVNTCIKKAKNKTKNKTKLSLLPKKEKMVTASATLLQEKPQQPQCARPGHTHNTTISAQSQEVSALCTSQKKN